MDIITSRDNKIIKEVKSLYTRQGRDEKKLFIVEGYRNVKDAFAKGAEAVYVLVREDCAYDLSFIGEKRRYILAKKIFDHVSDTVTPQGVMAVCRIKDLSFKDITLKKNSLIVVCENLQDPGNAGTVIRTADAAGAAGVIMAKGSVDIYNPKVVRSVMSSLFSVKVVRNKPIDAVFAYLESSGIRSVAGALRSDTEDLFNANLKGSCAIFVGNEGSGLLDTTIRRCKAAVKIPILGGAESLNASAAAAIMMYEHVRQNRDF